MSNQQWTAVDDYMNGMLIPREPALEAALRASDEAGLPSMQVAPNQGKLLSILARAIGARRILEIGTLGGYSTIWLAGALPEGGSLITLEADAKHAGVARSNIERAGLGELVEVRLGPALDSLPLIGAQGRAPFDLVFIDADKQNNAAYFEWALKLTRRGSLIIVDNVVRGGAVADPHTADSSAQGVQRFFEAVSGDARVSITAIQTVGSKGYDGLAVALVL